MKNSERKLWFSTICNELEEKDFNISWSSSDSDTENIPEIPSQKKIKLHGNNNQKTWISVINQQNGTPLKQGTRLNFNNQSLEISCTLTSPCSKDDFLDSPIIKSLKQDQSPPLIEDVITINPEEKSPVISRRSILKKIKWRYRLKKDMNLTQNIQDSSNSPNVLFSQPSILISDTQQTSCKPSPVKISPAKSEISPSWKIDPFPSQHGSEIPSTSTDSCDLGSSLYHEPPPRKKRFKKGGLAYQLQKALDAQSTSLAIWQHELYLSKTKNIEVQLTGSGDGIEFSFNLTNKWKEYGCTILECKFSSEMDCAKVSTSCSHLQVENNLFLIIIGMNISVNICFEVDKCYKIFPPYATKMVKYHLKQTLCFINASRFVSIN